VIGESEVACDIERTEACHAIDAGLEGVAPAAAESLRETPIGAAAGKREARNGVRREVIIQAAGIAIIAGVDIVRADRRVGGAAAAKGRAPRGPALIEGLRRRRLERRVKAERNIRIRRPARLLFRRKAVGVAVPPLKGQRSAM
jgi:hypothetical protein